MTETTNYHLNQWVKDDRIRMEDFNADNAKLDVALAAVPYVKILETVTTEDKAQVDVDVSGVDFTQYYHIDLFCSCAKPSDLVTLRINGRDTGYTYSVTSSNGSVRSTEQTFLARMGGLVLFFPPVAEEYVGCAYFHSSRHTSTGYQNVSDQIWSELKSFNLLRDSGIPAGTKIVLCGVRR